MKSFIGVDVSKATFDCAYIEASGKAHHQPFTMNQVGFDAAIAWSANKASHWVMEATGTYHQTLAHALYEAAQTVSIINPLVIKRFGQMQLKRAKTDKADAVLIAQYAHQQSAGLTAWEPAAQAINLLNSLDKWLESLVQQRTRLRNQREAMAHSADPSASVTEQLAQQLQLLDSQIKQIETELDELASSAYSECYQQLLSVPAIGRKTAAKLIAITHGFTRFESDKQLLSYIGLCPHTYQSGTAVRGAGHIVKMGMNRVRQLLYLCALSARRYNPACAQFAARLEAKGKPHKVVMIAVAAKLIRQVFAIVKSGTQFSVEASLA